MPPEPASSLPRKLLALRAGGAVFVLLVFSFWVFRASLWNDHLVLADTFGEDAPLRSFMQRADGVPGPDGTLAVAGGETAVRMYGITRGPLHRLFVRIDVLPGSPGLVGAWLLIGGERIPLDTSAFDGRLIELNEVMPAGNAQLEVWIRSTAPPGSPPAPFLRALAFERKGAAPAPRLPTFLFYGAVGLCFWLSVFGFAIPAAVEQLAADRAPLSPRGRALIPPAILAVTLAFGLLSRLPEWSAKKDYDDRAAIGNAAALLETGFDQSQVYFRSRVRPAFLGIAQPVLAMAPHRLSGYWINASDNFRQQWLIYDQEGWHFGLFTYPAMTLMSQFLALVMLAAVYGLLRRLEVAPLAAWAATLLVALYYGRSLTVAITQTVNLCINVLVVWHYLSSGPDAKPLPRFITGLMLGLAFLTKETAATTVIALALFTLVDGPLRGVGRRVLRSIPMWAGAALVPAFYFGLVAEGGFGELFTNFDNHLDQEQLNRFEALTWSTGFRDMRVVFSLAGLVAVAAGLAAAAGGRFRSRADRFMLCWSLGCLPVFTLPYIFPRFLKYFVPSFAYWSVRLVAFLAQWRARRENA